MIGGPDQIVEIDESFVGKRKYNVGRLANQKIILGGICRTTKKFFMKIVPRRDADTLKAVIIEHVAESTTIITDEWAAYRAIFRQELTYSHETVNHTYYFVDPNTGAHTQNIESLWSSFKRFKRRKGYSKQIFLDQYISEYSLRRNQNFASDQEVFSILLQCIFQINR